MKKNEIESKEKRAFWSMHLKNWKESSLTQAEYCRKNQLRDNQMIYWRQKLKKAKTKKSDNKSEISLVQLSMSSDSTSVAETSYLTPALKLNINSEYQIEIEKGFDPLTLMQMVNTIRHM